MPKTIPVTREFSKDPQDQIGKLMIFDDDFKIPYNSVFSLGGKILDNGEIEIVEVSLLSDENYLAYIKANKKSDEKFMKLLKDRKKKAKKSSTL